MNWHEFGIGLTFGLCLASGVAAVIAAITCIDADRNERPVRVSIAVACVIMCVIAFAAGRGLVAA
ncbi:membrane protein [Gordonia phage JKSyngboy]|uniref:Membrane protein n=1 Tax=Gordonia phage JKSyngboy TaxID=2762400 RepID=A0A7G8LLA9_9CAUD|nr:membrane protein [Gordonia phage JKSyngboy]QNJ58031.1 membrane protein [Gordonia phage JKSyngboy]